MYGTADPYIKARKIKRKIKMKQIFELIKKYFQKNWKDIVVAFVVTMIVGLLVAFTFNPRFGYIQNDFGIYDSSYFLFSGYMVQKGAIPYVDIWDQKGALLFLLNAVMYGEGSIAGIFVRMCLLNVINVMLFKQIFRKTALLFDFEQRIWHTALYAAFSAVFTMFGVNVETYIMILMEIVVIIVLDYNFWMYDERKGKVYAFLVGILIAMIFNIRAKEALFALVPLYFMIYNESHMGFRNTGAYVLRALTGFAIVTLPIVGFYAYIGEFDQWLFANITFNFEYIANVAGDSLSFICPASIIAILSFVLNRFGNPDPDSGYDEYKVIKVSLFVSGLIAFIGKGYFHYWIVTVPFSAVVIISSLSLALEGLLDKDADGDVRFWNIIRTAFVVVCLLAVWSEFVESFNATNFLAKDHEFDLSGQSYDYAIASDDLAWIVLEQTGKQIDEIYSLDFPGHVYIQESAEPGQSVYSYNSWWMAFQNKKVTEMLIDDIIDAGEQSEYIVTLNNYSISLFTNKLAKRGFIYEPIFQRDGIEILKRQ